mgnify:FL=1
MNKWGLPDEFFQTMERSKTAKKMWQLFLDRGVQLSVTEGKSAFSGCAPEFRYTILGLDVESYEILVANFCHEMVHCLQPFKQVKREELRQIALCPGATSEFRDRQTALHLWREIPAYKMTNRVLVELGCLPTPLEDWIYKYPVGGFRSSLHYYRQSHYESRISNFVDQCPEIVYAVA